LKDPSLARGRKSKNEEKKDWPVPEKEAAQSKEKNKGMSCKKNPSNGRANRTRGGKIAGDLGSQQAPEHKRVSRPLQGKNRGWHIGGGNTEIGGENG